jgi:MFS family permease
MLRALRSRDYRLFFGGQGISLIGTWLTRVATSWLVYQLIQPTTEANAAWMLAVVTFAGLIPTLLLAPVAGVIVDRHDRMRVMLITQVLALVQSAVLAALALAGIITVTHVIILQVFQGVINAFDAPARQALTVDLVDRREDLSNAIALNSAMFNGARLLGPVVAAAILARANPGWCFVIDAVSYVAVVATLLMLRNRPRRVIARQRKRPLQELGDGFRYAFGSPPVRALLLLASMVSMLSMSMQTLLPIFSTRLQSQWDAAHAYGALLTAMGAGALGATVYLAKRKTVVGLGRVIWVSAGLLGVAMVMFSFTTNLLPALPLVALAGAAMITTMAGSNTILQTIVDDDMRGRLMSFFTMAVMGMAPFGSLLAGQLTKWFEVTGSVFIAGTICFAGALLFAMKLPSLRPMVRKIYVAKGILPEIATGLRAATDATTTPD